MTLGVSLGALGALAVILLPACDKHDPPPPAKPAVDALAAKIAAHDTTKMFELTKIETLWTSDCKHQSVYERENLTDFLVIGLAKNIDEVGRPLCPCMFFEDKQEEIRKKEWICPCEEMQKWKFCH